MVTRIMYLQIVCFIFISTLLRGQELSFEDIKITWKDFKQRDDLPAGYFDAKINTKTFYTTEARSENGVIILTVNLEMYMDKENSWVKKQFMKSSDSETKTRLLNHEKLHMIVSLIQFKELVQSLDGTKFTRQYKSQLDSLVKRYNENTESVNKQYDEETNHMKIKDKQEEWEQKILQKFNEIYAGDKKIITKYRMETKIVRN